MSTKVKGDKIKEGSIPLSALATEVKGEFDGKYGYKNCKGVLNIHNNIVYAPINVYYIYSTDYNKSILLNPGSTVNLNSMGGPSINITSEISEGNKVKISIDNTSSVGSYGNLYVYQYHKSPTFPTPNWNAQEGEAGYIKNKPFYVYVVDVITSGGEHNMTLSAPNVIIHSNNLIVKCEDIERDKQYTISYGPPVKLTYTRNLDSNIVRIEDEIGYINENNPIIIGYINTINEMYIPDTVLKTTPQTLSDTDKNQALANIGIDPVVWKYMINPYHISSSRNGTIPNDLRSVIFDRNDKLKDIVLKLVVFEIPDDTNDDAAIYSAANIVGDRMSVIANNDAAYGVTIYPDGHITDW